MLSAAGRTSVSSTSQFRERYFWKWQQSKFLFLITWLIWFLPFTLSFCSIFFYFWFLFCSFLLFYFLSTSLFFFALSPALEMRNILERTTRKSQTTLSWTCKAHHIAPILSSWHSVLLNLTFSPHALLLSYFTISYQYLTYHFNQIGPYQKFAHSTRQPFIRQRDDQHNITKAM